MVTRRLLQQLDGNRLLIATSVFFGLLFSASGLVPPLVIRRVIQGIQDPDRTTPFVMLGAILLAVYLLRSACRYFYGVFSHIAAYRTLDRLITRAYQHLQRMSPEFFTRKRSGELVSRTIGDIESIEDFVAHGIPETLLAIVIPIAMMVILISINPMLTLLCAVPLAFVMLFLYLLVHHTRSIWKSVRGNIAELVAQVQDYISGMTVIQSFVHEKHTEHDIQEHSARYRDAIILANKWSLLPPAAIELTNGVGIILVVAMGGLAASNQEMPVADLVVFLMYIGQMIQPLLRFANLTENLQKATASAERVFELLDTKPSIRQPHNPVTPNPFNSRIIFDNVSFAYANGEDVLKQISFVVEPGEVVALVGPTGVGKTTATHLVPRFYDVTEGSVSIGDCDVRAMSLDFLRRQVAIVLQDVFLFHGSIRQNLLFGNPEATDEQLFEAIRASNAEPFVQMLPNGLDTIVGERGLRLSGGEKQRLSIARALLKDAPILILDEATSAVDAETESLIQNAVNRLSSGRTVLVIAHRLSTIQGADRVIVLESGEISQMGTHHQLMSVDGFYARIMKMQHASRDWQIGSTR